MKVNKYNDEWEASRWIEDDCERKTTLRGEQKTKKNFPTGDSEVSLAFHKPRSVSALMQPSRVMQKMSLL